MNKQECNRLVCLLKGVINQAEICTSKLKNGFLNTEDFNETQKTIERLNVEIAQLLLDTKP